MKGFAATPIIFIAVFLITVLLFVHFMDIDKQVAEGIGKEARMRKLQADALKNQTASVTELQSCMLISAQLSSNGTALKDNIDKCLNRTGVTVDGYTNGFTASYEMEYKSSTLIDASLNKNVTISERIEYPFFELAGATGNYSQSVVYNQTCSAMESKVYGYLGSTFPGISWNHTYTACSSSRKGLYLTQNWKTGTLSESHRHYTNIYAGYCNC